MAISDWSTTASSNGNSDANINWQEGQAPSTVNDSARSMMTRLKHWWNQLGGNITSGGSSNAYTLTSGESLSAYATGMRFLWKPNAAPTGAATMNVDAIGAKKIFLPDGTQVNSGELDANSFYDIVYDASLDTASGGFQILGFQDATLSETHLLASNNLSDLASASTARTNLGLGTSATVNTGTSGATVPLLNGANTWSGNQTIENSGPVLQLTDTSAADQKWRFISFTGNLRLQRDSAGDNSWATTYLQWDASHNLNIPAGTLSVGGSTVWHAGNDGAGSGLDADTLDGVQASGFAQLAAAQTFTALNVFNAADEATNAFRVSNSSTSRRSHFYAGKMGSQNGNLDLDAEDGNNVRLMTSGTARVTISPTAATFAVPGQMPVAISSETSGTLTSASANKTIQLAGTITVPNSVFSAGDMIVVYAGASSRTITQGSGLTMRLGGTSTTGSRTLAARGMATIFFVSASECVVSGGAVT